MTIKPLVYKGGNCNSIKTPSMRYGGQARASLLTSSVQISFESALVCTCMLFLLLNILKSTGSEVCSPGKFGENCTKDCPPSCLNSTCHKTLGSCTHGCKPGHSDSRFCCVNNSFCARCSSPVSCTECVKGQHGTNCALACPVNCQGTCDMSSGNCHECKENFYGKDCQLSCSKNCITLQNGSASCHQGNGYCKLGCKLASNCNGTCDQLNGVCSSCKHNYYGQLCENSCPEQCLKFQNNTPVCLRENGNCFSGCEEQFYGEQCESQCSYECKDSCSQKVGACYSCRNDKYGSHCEYACPKTCTHSGTGDSSCHKENGTCRTACIVGYYGAFCGSMCSDGCRGNACDRVTGACLDGCLQRYSGTHCDHAASDDFLLKAAVVGLCAAVVSVVLTLGLAAICGRCKNRSSEGNSASSRSAARENYNHLELALQNQEARENSHIYSTTRRHSSHIYCNTTLRSCE